MTLKTSVAHSMLILLTYLVLGPEVFADEGTQTTTPVISGATDTNQGDTSSEIRPSFLLNIEL
ncbi:MAG: hypothetical protein ABIQ95_16435, partial [Bdellovibrionia bacterium]